MFMTVAADSESTVLSDRLATFPHKHAHTGTFAPGGKCEEIYLPVTPPSGGERSSAAEYSAR